MLSSRGRVLADIIAMMSASPDPMRLTIDLAAVDGRVRHLGIGVGDGSRSGEAEARRFLDGGRPDARAAGGFGDDVVRRSRRGKIMGGDGWSPPEDDGGVIIPQDAPGWRHVLAAGQSRHRIAEIRLLSDRIPLPRVPVSRRRDRPS